MEYNFTLNQTVEGWKNEQELVTAAQKLLRETEREAELQESSWNWDTEFKIPVVQQNIFNI